MGDRVLPAALFSFHSGHGGGRHRHGGGRAASASLRSGDRVAYAGPIGAYAEERLIAADRVVKIPAEIDDQVAAPSCSRA